MNQAEENKKKVIKNLEETRDCQHRAIDEIKKAVDDLPFLNESNRLTEKNLEALEKVPTQCFATFPDDVSQLIESNMKNAEFYYDRVKQIPTSTMVVATSAAYSCAVMVYGWLDKTENWSVTDVAPAIDVLKTSLDDKQNRESKRAGIREVLARLLPPENNRFDEIIHEYEKVIGDIQKLESLALLMRTLLEKVKGELKLRLPNQIGIGDNKILPAVAEQLLDPSKTSPAYVTYTILIGQYPPFMLKLTNIGKWNIKTLTDIDHLMLEFENMLYSLLLPIKHKL
jgi:hypothetical protein